MKGPARALFFVEAANKVIYALKRGTQQKDALATVSFGSDVYIFASLGPAF